MARDADDVGWVGGELEQHGRRIGIDDDVDPDRGNGGWRQTTSGPSQARARALTVDGAGRDADEEDGCAVRSGQAECNRGALSANSSFGVSTTGSAGRPALHPFTNS